MISYFVPIDKLLLISLVYKEPVLNHARRVSFKHDVIDKKNLESIQILSVYCKYLLTP